MSWRESLPHFNSKPPANISQNHERTNLTSKMPLLSLPNELLLDIIQEAVATPFSSSAGYCHEFVGPTLPIISPSTTSLAHSCKLLRSLTVPLLYASVNAHPRSTPALHAQLTSHVHIAECVQKLTVFITDAPGAQLLHGIIKRCPKLRDLRLDGAYANQDFTATLLMHVTPHPLNTLSLRGFHLDNILLYLSTAPPGVQTVRIEDPVTDLVNPDAPAISSLPDVRTLIWSTGAWDSFPPCTRVTDIAKMMPNIEKLGLKISTRSFPLLEHYANLGTRLTELTLQFDQTPMGFCGTVAKLAPSLRRFVAHGGIMCEQLFGADWGCVEYFDVKCERGCDTIQVNVMREALVKLVCDRPAAEVLVTVVGVEALVRFSGGVGDVAAVETFSAMVEEEDGEYYSDLFA